MTDLNIKSLDIANASQAEYAAINRHTNRLRAERLPDDPPVPLDEQIKSYQAIPAYVDVRAWVAWDRQGEAAATGNVAFLRLEENRHLAQFEITVDSDHRRRGWGRNLLALIAAETAADGRRLLITETSDRVPGGEAFMKRIGARPGLVGHVNQLRTAELDRALLKKWVEQAAERAAGFEIGLWDGPYPDDQIGAVVQLYELTNQQPFGDLEIEEMHSSADQLREAEKQLFARGSQRWTIYAVEKATGKFAGYTETIWNPNRPENLSQEMTGVFPEFRGRGLGRWLKAAMMEKVLNERPQVKFVRTQNADVNETMLAINTELGFRPYMASTLWQADLDAVQAYLAGSNN